MNIDRDDEYATRYEAAPTIAEQIEYAKYLQFQINNPKVSAILASLEKLAALESQPVPVEPEIPTVYYVTIPTGEYASVVTTASLSKWRAYINTLQSALKLAQEELANIRDALAGQDYASLPSDFPTVRMAHTIRADHDKFLQQVRDTCERAEKADAVNRRMVELMKEAQRLLRLRDNLIHEDCVKRIDELLKEVEK